MSRLYAESDQRIFEIPCAECDDFSEVTWKDIQWPEGEPEKAAWCCPECGCVVQERWKAQMIDNGRWRATAPKVKGHAGFRINALVSPHANASWGKLAAEFLRAKDNPATLQTFVNLTLGQPWRNTEDDLDEHELASKREPFGLLCLPPEVLIITAGVDCQDDRLELVFMGHGKDDQAFILGHSVIWGAIDADTTWEELEDALRTQFDHPSGGTLNVDAAVIDSGDGGHSDLVHSFTRSRFNRRIVSGKGVSGFSRPFIHRSTTKGAPLFLIGVDSIKAQLFNRLARGDTFRFSADLTQIFFEQLTSERRVLRYLRGAPVRRFERIPGKRAETLDSTVYAMAARQLVSLDMGRRESEVASVAIPKKAPNIVKSHWLGN